MNRSQGSPLWLTLFSFLLLFSPLDLLAQTPPPEPEIQATKPALLPMPQSIEWGHQAIAFDTVDISIPKNIQDPLKAWQLVSEIKQLFARNQMQRRKGAPTKIIFRFGKVEVPGHWEGQDQEAYELEAGPQGVLITANQIDGLYYGLQTLRQLILRQDGKTTLAACKIKDYPAFKIRGFMHDVGRNFQSLDQLKMQIDVMAAYKLNVFHWHLTEYYAWRLESKKYPELQSDRAFERGAGKFYTQKEFREMSDYCWARGITIIPEFDSPGHSGAFRRALKLKNMKEPKARQAMCELFEELCSLADAKRMPYIHVGTDEVRHHEEHVNADYLPALHQTIHEQGREVIGWWKGMVIKGDQRQILQSWAQYNPIKGYRHIDSRSNYVNHLEALDFTTRMHFQQVCRRPHGNDTELGGILAHWPDTKVDNQKLILTNNPVIPAMVAYSEAVWTGLKKDHKGYWAKVPPVGTPEFESFKDFEDRLAEQRDRFLTQVPFPMVKTYPIEWRLLGPVADGEIPALDQGEVQDEYRVDQQNYSWGEPIRGGAIHIKHFFSFSHHLSPLPKGKDVVWANSHIYSPKDQVVDAWINFNTLSTSDYRANSPAAGNWGSNPLCKIWLNGQPIAPPKWKHSGKSGKEDPIVDQIYSSRAPTKIRLRQGWNSVLIKAAPKFKWVFSFSPVLPQGPSYREVPGLKYAATPPAQD